MIDQAGAPRTRMPIRSDCPLVAEDRPTARNRRSAGIRANGVEPGPVLLVLELVSVRVRFLDLE